ncbi:MAG: Ig-like domain-containing protein [Oculatellaceae cyanobacterium Prado106]|nr:Ig-like domain-containing protein [Oculatellaceae cyanobacterium Prado106]
MTTDYTKPLKPSQPDLTNTSDNGVDTSDDETTKRKPTISGTAEPGSTLRIFDGGVEVGTVKVALDGSWNYTFRTKLTQTTHTITVQAEDLAGNLSDASDPLILVVATPPAPPTGIELIAADDSGSSNTDNITNVQLPTFSGKAAPGLTVELYDENNDKIGTGIANASGDWTITSTKTLPDGNRTIKAIAIDLTKGYRSDDDEDVPQPTLGIVIDTLSQAPSQPDLSAADDSGLSNSDNITNVLLPEFSGTAEPGSSVELFSDQEGAIGTVTAGSDGKWTIRSTKPLRQGKHKITARVQDIAGNPVSAPSAPLDIEIDDENPLAAPTGLDMTAATDTGISNSDDITGDNTPDFTGNAEPNSRVTLTSDKDGVIGTATANGSGVWTLTASKNLQGGVHVITAVASDVAGNESPVSSPLNITIVPPPPAPPAPRHGCANGQRPQY